MSWAEIIDGGEDGRYTIYLDYGEAQRAAILQQVTLAQAKLAEKVVAQQVRIDAADAEEAASLVQLQAVQDGLIAQMGIGGNGPEDSALKAYTDGIRRHQQLMASHQPIRAAMRNLETQQERAASQLAYWSSVTASETKQAWCCDLTEDATGYVATVDIPGETNLILIAPGGRAWQGKDGTIAQSKKDAALSLLNGRLTIATAEHAELVAKLAATTAAETTLNAAVASAQANLAAAYASGDEYAISLAQKAFDDATRALNANRQLVTQLTLSVFNAALRITKLNQEIAIWTAKPASETPVYGDGSFLARELMSPEQAYFNAAILPGWQKYMPTYRWATVDAVNDDDTLDITFGAAVSSAYSLEVNKTESLQSVPVTYMSCNANAFSVDDRCIVAFDSSYPNGPDVWTNEKCRVIGFLDNPKRCGNVILTSLAVVQSITETPHIGIFHIFEYYGTFLDSTKWSAIISSPTTHSFFARKNMGAWEQLTRISGSQWTVQVNPPEGGVYIYVTARFGFPGDFSSDPNARFAISISTINNWSAPGDVVEFIGRNASGTPIFNAAITIESLAGGTITNSAGSPPSVINTFADLTGYALTKTAIAQIPESPNNIQKLRDYVLES